MIYAHKQTAEYIRAIHEILTIAGYGHDSLMLALDLTAARNSFGEPIDLKRLAEGTTLDAINDVDAVIAGIDRETGIVTGITLKCGWIRRGQPYRKGERVRVTVPGETPWESRVLADQCGQRVNVESFRPGYSRFVLPAMLERLDQSHKEVRDADGDADPMFAGRDEICATDGNGDPGIGDSPERFDTSAM